ncbi:MAG: GGDEF domain-containing protein [Fibromonadaceae bacterium]|jgi:diguanylate cyclase (GGDEF)-like protein|nr:GGDEF domain-containing protein [Fibromonadaceae bacterium]
MKVDLFEHEQQVYDRAANHSAEVRSKKTSLCLEEYSVLVKEYGRMLKQLRRATRIADRTTTGLYESNLSLSDKVNFDALTGIYNRRYMEDNMKKIINFLLRGGGGRISVMMLDIDNFKLYNDTYGHSMGDECLKSVAQALTASVTRADDFVARYGGEEFAVILPNTSEMGARKVAGTILKNVMELEVPHEKNEAGIVTISIGITHGNITLPVDGSSYPQDGNCYIKRADEALYMSKRSGRNRYTYLAMEEKV